MCSSREKDGSKRKGETQKNGPESQGEKSWDQNPMWKKRMGKHMKWMKSSKTGGKRDSMTEIFPEQLLIKCQNCREMKIEIVRSFLLVCPVLRLLMKPI